MNVGIGIWDFGAMGFVGTWISEIWEIGNMGFWEYWISNKARQVLACTQESRIGGPSLAKSPKGLE